MPHYAIGDVQGCFAELKALLKAIEYHEEKDQLWFTGDLVNRGPESLNTLRFIKSLLNIIVVLGNHDLHLLAVGSGYVDFKKQDTMHEILEAPDKPELFTWLRNQSILHHDSKLGYTMTHAGIPPQWDLSKASAAAKELEDVLRHESYTDFFLHMYGNTPKKWEEDLTGWDRLRFIANAFTRMRFCDSEGGLDLSVKGSVGSQPEGYLPWFKVPWRANKNLRILFGHWAALQGQCDEPNVFPLDTGCVWGNCLTALRLEDNKYFSVPCKKRDNLEK